jgi:hypothetical protein
MTLIFESFLLRVEVGGVGWQVEKLAVRTLDQLLDPISLVGTEGVYHYELTSR